MVFPSPISSASIPLMPWSYRFANQFIPCNGSVKNINTHWQVSCKNTLQQIHIKQHHDLLKCSVLYKIISTSSSASWSSHDKFVALYCVPLGLWTRISQLVFPSIWFCVWDAALHGSSGSRSKQYSRKRLKTQNRQNQNTKYIQCSSM